MACLKLRISFHCFALLLFCVQHVLSTQSSGILSTLYKKAAEENRPLILVLDNSQGTSKLDNSLKSSDFSSNSYSKNVPQKQSTMDYDKEDQSLLPYLLLKKLGQQISESKYHPKSFKIHDHSLTRSKSRSRLRSRDQNLRTRLRTQINRDDGDLNSIQSFIARNLDDNNGRSQYEIERDEANDRALRTSVIKNLLRYSNDLNCEAQTECVDVCDNNYNGKKKDDCEDKCEQKYDCEEEKEKEKEDDCDLSDDCGEAADENPSTRGERLVPEKVENKCC